jgi:hypothetical protein
MDLALFTSSMEGGATTSHAAERHDDKLPQSDWKVQHERLGEAITQNLSNKCSYGSSIATSSTMEGGNATSHAIGKALPKSH